MLKVRTEQHGHAATFSSPLKDCFAFVVENHGTVNCEVRFDRDAPVYVPLPPGCSRSFDMVGNTPYQGDIEGRFDPNATEGSKVVFIMKTVLICS